jgi:hypothetical protein
MSCRSRSHDGPVVYPVLHARVCHGCSRMVTSIRRAVPDPHKRWFWRRGSACRVVAYPSNGELLYVSLIDRHWHIRSNVPVTAPLSLSLLVSLSLH